MGVDGGHQSFTSPLFFSDFLLLLIVARQITQSLARLHLNRRVIQGGLESSHNFSRAGSDEKVSVS